MMTLESGGIGSFCLSFPLTRSDLTLLRVFSNRSDVRVVSLNPSLCSEYHYHTVCYSYIVLYTMNATHSMHIFVYWIPG